MLILTEQDLDELYRLVEDFRHKEASALIVFMNRKTIEQREKARVAAHSRSSAHDEQPSPPQNGAAPPQDRQASAGRS